MLPQNFEFDTLLEWFWGTSWHFLTLIPSYIVLAYYSKSHHSWNVEMIVILR